MVSFDETFTDAPKLLAEIESTDLTPASALLLCRFNEILISGEEVSFPQDSPSFGVVNVSTSALFSATCALLDASCYAQELVERSSASRQVYALDESDTCSVGGKRVELWFIVEQVMLDFGQVRLADANRVDRMGERKVP